MGMAAGKVEVLLVVNGPDVDRSTSDSTLICNCFFNRLWGV
jgi:hypothetical protein